MYPGLECVGWYSSIAATSNANINAALQGGDRPTQEDFEFHKGVVTKLTDDPLLLLMNLHSTIAKNRRKIPLFLFESAPMEAKFIDLDFTMASSDSEQIAVNDFAMATDADAKVSACS